MAPVTALSLSDIDKSEHVAKLGGLAGIAKVLATDLKNGLTDDNVTKNRAAYGANKLVPKALKSFWDHLLEALSDDTLRILMFSAFCSIAFAFLVTNDDGKEEDMIQGLAILLTVVVVSGVQSVQNLSKDREFQSLANIRENRNIHVMRNGKEVAVSIHDVVVGDLVRLTSGDRIPCDGLLVGGFDCEVDESGESGESELVSKTEGGDCVLKGNTELREGEGFMIATAVGTNSRIGRTVKELEDTEPEDTPLQVNLNELAGQIGKIGTGAGTITFLVLSLLWYLRTDPNKSMLEILQYFIIGVAIVVVAVPEGLPLAVTISLAFSMKRMMADNNLVRTLSACETMGSATIIASDKTGTLTENRMSVKEAYVYGEYVDKMDQLKDTIKDPGAIARLAKAIACNSTADLDFSNPSRVTFIRSPSECAMLFMLHQWLGVDYQAVRSDGSHPLARRPFRKDKKYMSTIIHGTASDGKARLYITGAPEVVLAICTFEATKKGDKIDITKEESQKDHLTEQVRAMAHRGLRTLAVAFIELPTGKVGDKLQSELMSGNLEKNATLLGLFGLQDPLREGVPEAVKACNNAGIRVLMVTGDHIDTARTIAKECKIYKPGSLVIDGETFRNMSEVQRIDAAKRLSVIARCAPSDKLLLVKTLQALGEVVAVTGDGTNDALALRAADVGLAMGIAGTEVAKEASDIVIMDDRFSSIVASVRWGRSIKENIRKFLTFQLTINIVALTLTFVSACTSGGRSELPLKPVQLLWVNLIMDSFAALALATEPPSEKLMTFRPQGKNESLITGIMMKNMIGHALYQTALLLWMTQVPSSATYFHVAPGQLGSMEHDTVVFTAFVALQVFNLFNCRSVHDEWNILEDFSSSVVAQVILVVIVIMQVVIVQLWGGIMQTVPLSWDQWVSCVAVGFTSIPIGFLLKLIPACRTEMSNILPASEEMEEGESACTSEEPVAEAATSGKSGRAKPRKNRPGKE